MTKEQEQAISVLESHTKWAEQNKYPYESPEDVKAYSIAIQAIKDLDKMNGIALDLASENDDLIEKLDSIRAEILAYKDDKSYHWERNEMIDIMVDILDKYREESKDAGGN